MSVVGALLQRIHDASVEFGRALTEAETRFLLLYGRGPRAESLFKAMKYRKRYLSKGRAMAKRRAGKRG